MRKILIQAVSLRLLFLCLFYVLPNECCHMYTVWEINTVKLNKYDNGIASSMKE